MYPGFQLVAMGSFTCLKDSLGVSRKRGFGGEDLIESTGWPFSRPCRDVLTRHEENKVRIRVPFNISKSKSGNGQTWDKHPILDQWRPKTARVKTKGEVPAFATCTPA